MSAFTANLRGWRGAYIAIAIAMMGVLASADFGVFELADSTERYGHMMFSAYLLFGLVLTAALPRKKINETSNG